jgi:hypothetical protein
MSICNRLGQLWVCLQQHHGNKQPFNFSIKWLSSSSLTSTHDWERWKQTTLLREHKGGLLPCGSNDVCVGLSSLLDVDWHFAPN